MTHYIVRWEIDLECDTPEEAAQEAAEIMRDLNSTATVFEVFNYPSMKKVATIDAEK